MFDCIIMNPPFKGSLHLNIVEQALQHSNLVINLSPIRWLQDPLGPYKKSDYNRHKHLLSHIVSLNTIPAKDAITNFDAGFTDLGLYKLTKEKLATPYEPVYFDNDEDRELFEKVVVPVVLGKFDSVANHRTPAGKADFSTPFVRLPTLHGHMGQADFLQLLSPKKHLYLNKPKKVSTIESTANFATQEEANNFLNSLYTDFMVRINNLTKTNIRVPYETLPWMGDYTQPWTDERLREYFGMEKYNK